MNPNTTNATPIMALTKAEREFILAVGGEAMLKRVLAAEDAKAQDADSQKASDMLTARKVSRSLVERLVHGEPFQSKAQGKPLVEQLVKGVK